MTARDFALLVVICFCWGAALVLTRWVVTDFPPLFYAFLRFALIGVVLLPWLLPVPRQWRTIVVVAMCVGGFNFALLFLALKYGTASSVAIAGQLGLPFSTILSVMFLGETVRWRRAMGMVLAFIGVVIIAYNPASLGFSLGVVLAAASALIGSVGGLLLKKMEPVGVFNLQAWVATLSWPVLLPLTLVAETGQLEALARASWGFWAALLFTAFAVSIFGHGMFYKLIQKYEATLISPLTLMTPVWAVVLGVTFLGEPLTAQLALGAAVALTGVAIIAVRPNISFAGAINMWRRWTS
jgi:O-acetylserine/cysteine efflux transporter